MREYKEIYLDYRSHPITITPAAYEQIAALVRASMICKFCTKGYTDANPMVVENVCLGCFLKHRDAPPRDLAFVGEVTSEYAARYNYKTYKFLDSRGYVYLIHSSSQLQDSLSQDTRATVMHYGFKVPETYVTKSGTTVELETGSWVSIYGDFKTSPVILVRYHEYYGNHIETAFLLYRDREPVEFTRRKNPTRQWYNEAKAQIEATKTPNRGYIISTGADGEDRTTYQIEDHHVYPGIVARAAAEYNKAHGIH